MASTPSQLSIYNGALRKLGQTKLSGLTEDREARYVLDDIWTDGGVEACLEMGFWNFAMKTTQVSSDPDVTPQYGYQYAYSKPADWVKTAAVCSDEFFHTPILHYNDETDYVYADIEPLYFRYVSDHADYGLNYAGWPESFRDLVHCYFAREMAPTILKNKGEVEAMETRFKKALSEAKNRDAMNQPTMFPAPGTFVRSRSGGTGERGRRGQLIG